MSMLIPTLIFRFILNKNPKQDVDDQIYRVRHEMVARGIRSLDDLEISKEVKDSITYDLNDQISKNTVHNFLWQWNDVNGTVGIFESSLRAQEHQALLHAFAVYQQYLCDIIDTGVIDSKQLDDIFSELLLAESLIMDPRNQVEE